MIAFNNFKEEHNALLSFRQGGSGAPVVLIHGLAESATCWEAIAPRLAQQYSVWLPNLPGTAGSSLPAAGLPNIAAIAATLYAFLQQQGIRKALFVGHSMGGYVALALLQQHPQLFWGLTLLHSTPAADTDAKKEGRAQAIALLEGGKRKAYLKALIESMFAPAFLNLHPQIVAAHLSAAVQIPASTLIAHNKAMATRQNTAEVLRHSPVPVQWIMGEEDAIIDVNAVLEFAALPAIASVSIYKGVGHAAFWEAPERLLADLLAFAEQCAMC